MQDEANISSPRAASDQPGTLQLFSVWSENETELSRREGSTYEPACALLTRIRAERSGSVEHKGSGKTICMFRSETKRDKRAK
jgi:hypothetical protein